MIPPMLFELLPRAQASRTYIHISRLLAYRVGTFDADGVGEVAHAAVAFYLQSRLVYSCSSRVSRYEEEEER